jgi:hypothetical protein
MDSTAVSQSASLSIPDSDLTDPFFGPNLTHSTNTIFKTITKPVTHYRTWIEQRSLCHVANSSYMLEIEIGPEGDLPIHSVANLELIMTANIAIMNLLLQNLINVTVQFGTEILLDLDGQTIYQFINYNKSLKFGKLATYQQEIQLYLPIQQLMMDHNLLFLGDRQLRIIVRYNCDVDLVLRAEMICDAIQHTNTEYKKIASCTQEYHMYGYYVERFEWDNWRTTELTCPFEYKLPVFEIIVDIQSDSHNPYDYNVTLDKMPFIKTNHPFRKMNDPTKDSARFGESAWIFKAGLSHTQLCVQEISGLIYPQAGRQIHIRSKSDKPNHSNPNVKPSAENPNVCIYFKYKKLVGITNSKIIPIDQFKNYPN